MGSSQEGLSAGVSLRVLSAGVTAAAERSRIESRYQSDRVRCDALAGFKRDKCLIRAHATKGRAMLEAAAPYEAVRYPP